MEFPAKVTRLGQLLLAAMIAVVGACLWLESRSPLSAALRSGQPWVCWLWLTPPDALGSDINSEPPGTELYLALYQPGRRILDVIYIPPKSHSAEARAALAAELPLTQGRDFIQEIGAVTLGRSAGEPPLSTAQWMLDSTQGLGFWKTVARSLKNIQLSTDTLDRLLLAVELHRMRPENLRAAWLPETEEQRRFFFGNIFAPPSDTRTGGRAIAVEVLNATLKAGIASTATDILRSNGADVVNVGNAPSPREKTVIYDRTGRAENGAAVREFLGCESARVVTQISPKKLVDVTVVLAEDCASPEKRGMKWNSLRF